MASFGDSEMGMHPKAWHRKGFRLDGKGKGLGLVERNGKAICSVNTA